MEKVYPTVIDALKGKQYDKTLYRGFVNCGKEDIIAAEILYANKQYALATYHLQQSVEKLIKAWALTTRIISKQDLMDIGHKSPRAILKILDEKGLLGKIAPELSSIEKIDVKKEKEKLIDFLSAPDEEIATISFGDIMEFRTNVIANDITPYTTALSDSKLIEKALEYGKKTIPNAKQNAQIDPKELFEKMNKYADMLQRLFFLAFITFPHWLFTRYPDKEIKPTNYNIDFPIVQAFPELKEDVRLIIEQLEKER